MVTYPSSSITLPDDAHIIAGEIKERYQFLENKWVGLRGRQHDIRSLVENRWGDVYRGEVSDSNLPMIANFFRDQVEDIGRLFAKIMPTTRVFARDHTDDTDPRGAELRERIAVGYDERSHLRNALALHGMDYPAAGYTAVKVWPEKGYSGAQRFPVFRRLDPLCVLPEELWAPDRPTEYAAITEEWPLSKLEKVFPAQHAALAARLSSDEIRGAAYGYDLQRMSAAAREIRVPKVTIVDWYSCEFIGKAAIYKHEPGKAECELLVWLPNPTGLCPVQISYRPTWGAEPQGLLDDSKGPIQTRNRYWHMLLDYFVQMVYGGTLVWQVKNPTDRGPNQTFWALGPDAYMKKIGPDSPSVAAMQVIAQLESEGREGAVKPSAREGEVNLNKSTAAFLTRAQGKLSDLVMALHDQFAMTKQRLNEIAFEQDKAWCEAEGKEISGIARGRRFADRYTPSRDITDTATWVSYGPASGLDLPTHTVLNQNKVQIGMMSRETAIEQDPGIEEAAEELSRIRMQTLADGFIGQVASEGLSAAGEALLAFDEGVPLADFVRRTLAAKARETSAVPPVVGGAGPAASGAPNPAAALGPPEAESPAVPLPPPALLRAGRR